MTWIMVDVEADGPIPGDYSMIEIGAVLVDVDLGTRFSANLRPISDRFQPEALAITGYGRPETLAFEDPAVVTRRFAEWVDRVGGGSPRFVADNNGFDWMYACWYFHHFLGRNPFGYSSTNLGSLFKGVERDFAASFKTLRKTAHSHKAVDDALGNAEAMLEIIRRYGISH